MWPTPQLIFRVFKPASYLHRFGPLPSRSHLMECCSFCFEVVFHAMFVISHCSRGRPMFLVCSSGQIHVYYTVFLLCSTGRSLYAVIALVQILLYPRGLGSSLRRLLARLTLSHDFISCLPCLTRGSHLSVSRTYLYSSPWHSWRIVLFDG